MGNECSTGKKINMLLAPLYDISAPVSANSSNLSLFVLVLIEINFTTGLCYFLARYISILCGSSTKSSKLTGFIPFIVGLRTVCT